MWRHSAVGVFCLLLFPTTHPCLFFQVLMPSFSPLPVFFLVDASHFLMEVIFFSQSGEVVCVLVEDWDTTSSYKHSVGVRKVFPDQNGTWLVFIDNKNSGFLLCPAKVRIYSYLKQLYMYRHIRHKHTLYSEGFCTKNQIIYFCII